MKDAAKDAVQGMMDKAVEAPVHADQKDVELKLLATLASIINFNQAVLKYDILEMDASDFHSRDHAGIFAAMKTLDAAGDHVDQITVRARVGDAWPETLKDIFDASKADASAAMTYKRQVIRWRKIEDARAVGRDFTAALDQAEKDADADPSALVADLQRAVFDLDRTDRIAPTVRSEAELIDGFLLDLANPTPGYAMGFPMLEGIIRGLTPGLFVIAAPPSAGKTTFVKQLADQVARLNKVPVLFFSFEQSADELRIKSLARLSKEIRSPVKNEDIKEGLSSAERERSKRVEDAAKAYKQFAAWIKVIEGDRQHTVERIRLMAQREKMKTGKAPVIVVDYLQVLPVADPTQDRRIAIDFLISDLRRIARDIGSPVIAISAMSRAEYKEVNIAGFKESGGIEYGADIAAILSIEGESEGGTERTVALNVIKNRNGRRGKVGMKYDMAHDDFQEEDWQNVNYLDALGKAK